VSHLRPWTLAGTYLEACNCDTICPCRRIGGRPGGRSTYGICMGALSWAIEDGRAGGTDLAGQRVVLVCRYDDDEPGSPWDFFLYLEDAADDSQREGLAAIFLGRAGGTPLLQFPWAFKPSRLIEVRTARIEVDHAPRRGWFRAGSDVEVRVSGPVDDQEPVTCVIPGHQQPGAELHVDELRSTAAPIDYTFSGRCGYEARFSYSSEDGPA
jgi:hypothetical protein